MGNKGKRIFISRELGNKSLKLKGTGEQRQLWGTGNIENQDFDFGEQGKCRFFQGNKGTGTPSRMASIFQNLIYGEILRDFLRSTHDPKHPLQ